MRASHAWSECDEAGYSVPHNLIWGIFRIFPINDMEPFENSGTWTRHHPPVFKQPDTSKQLPEASNQNTSRKPIK